MKQIGKFNPTLAHTPAKVIGACRRNKMAAVDKAENDGGGFKIARRDFLFAAGTTATVGLGASDAKAAIETSTTRLDAHTHFSPPEFLEFAERTEGRPFALAPLYKSLPTPQSSSLYPLSEPRDERRAERHPRSVPMRRWRHRMVGGAEVSGALSYGVGNRWPPAVAHSAIGGKAPPVNDTKRRR